MGREKHPKKQTSTVSVTQVMATLVENGYTTQNAATQQRAIRPTERNPVKQARGMFGTKVDVSKGGHMVYFTSEDGQTRVGVRTTGMMGHGELSAVEKKTGLKFTGNKARP